MNTIFKILWYDSNLMNIITNCITDKLLILCSRLKKGMEKSQWLKAAVKKLLVMLTVISATNPNGKKDQKYICGFDGQLHRILI